MIKVIGAGVMAAAFIVVVAGQGDEVFQTAVRSYVDLHRAAAATVPSASGRAEVPEVTQRALAQRIQSNRQGATQGDILGPVAIRIRKLVHSELSGPQGAAMLSVVQQTNVYGVRLRVNRRYPAALPRVTMPAPLLAKLPDLPPELEYRFLGRSLLLIDSDAALVIDFIPDVLPPSVVRSRAGQ
jgi:hypothetical protein